LDTVIWGGGNHSGERGKRAQYRKHHLRCGQEQRAPAEERKGDWSREGRAASRALRKKHCSLGEVRKAKGVEEGVPSSRKGKRLHRSRRGKGKKITPHQGPAPREGAPPLCDRKKSEIVGEEKHAPRRSKGGARGGDIRKKVLAISGARRRSPCQAGGGEGKIGGERKKRESWNIALSGRQIALCPSEIECSWKKKSSGSQKKENRDRASTVGKSGLRRPGEKKRDRGGRK